MKVLKVLVSGMLTVGVLMGTAACSSSTTPAPISTQQVKTAQTQVAATYEKFTNGVFGMTPATATKLSNLYNDVTTTNYTKLTDAQAKNIISQTLAYVPAMKYVDVTGYTPQQQVAVYAYTLAIATYVIGHKTTITVNPNKVLVASDGKSAEIPTSAVSVSNNGVPATPSATATPGTSTVPFVKIGTNWYISGESVLGSSN